MSIQGWVGGDASVLFLVYQSITLEQLQHGEGGGRWGETGERNNLAIRLNNIQHLPIKTFDTLLTAIQPQIHILGLPKCLISPRKTANSNKLSLSCIVSNSELKENQTLLKRDKITFYWRLHKAKIYSKSARWTLKSWSQNVTKIYPKNLSIYNISS